MTIITKPPRYDYRGLSISRYVKISIYCPSLEFCTVPNSPTILFGLCCRRTWHNRKTCESDTVQLIYANSIQKSPPKLGPFVFFYVLYKNCCDPGLPKRFQWLKVFFSLPPLLSLVPAPPPPPPPFLLPFPHFLIVFPLL